MEAMSKFNAAFSVGGAFIGLPIFTLIITALYWVVFNALLGGTAAFKQVLAVVTHSQVISALGAAIGAPIQMMQGTITMGGPFNLAALVPFLDESVADPGDAGRHQRLHAVGHHRHGDRPGRPLSPQDPQHRDCTIGCVLPHHRGLRRWVLGADGRTERWISE